jgi:hypothetical protein
MTKVKHKLIKAPIGDESSPSKRKNMDMVSRSQIKGMLNEQILPLFRKLLLDFYLVS